MHGVNFDDYANNYNDLCEEQHRFFTNDNGYFARNKLKLIKKNVNELSHPVNILEYGCGVGNNMRFIRETFPQANIYGCDLSNKSLEIARKYNSFAHFFNNGAESVQYVFDLIIISCVFHHVPKIEIKNVLSNIKSMLHRKGNVFIFEHNPYNPITRRLVNTCPFDKDVTLISRKRMKKILSIADFNITNSQYTLFLPPKLSEKFVFKFESYIGWLPLGGQYFVQAALSKNPFQ